MADPQYAEVTQKFRELVDALHNVVDAPSKLVLVVTGRRGYYEDLISSIPIENDFLLLSYEESSLQRKIEDK